MDFNDILQIIISPTTAAFALAAIGLNFHYGLTGLLNMGVAGFMLIGMYGYGISVSHGVPAWARPHHRHCRRHIVLAAARLANAAATEATTSPSSPSRLRR